MIYIVSENWQGATLYWSAPNGRGGSASYSSPTAARRVAKETEGRTLTWKRSGTRGAYTWRAEA